MTAPQTPPADEKDWTFVLTRGCGQCGFQPGFDVATTGERIRAALPGWREVLSRPGVGSRPGPQVWSPLEYGCHVRDVFDVFAGRLALMLGEDGARFANWDQDAAAVAGRYSEQEPTAVAGELTASGLSLAAGFEAVPRGAWGNRGLRSDGTEFTVASFAAYLLHEIEHHRHDVGA